MTGLIRNQMKAFFRRCWHWIIDKPTPVTAWARILLLLGLNGLAWGFLETHILNWFNSKTHQLIADSYANLGFELLSISATVLIIDGSYSRYQREQYKQTLFRQLTHPSNDFAINAVIEIRKEPGWWEEALESHRNKETGFVEFAYVQWQCAKQGHVQLTGVTLSKDILLQYANLTGIDFSNANLSNGTFYDTVLAATILANANLENALLINANLRGTSAVGANLANADLSLTTLSGATFMGASLLNANLFEASAVDADFTGANLQGVNLSGADLSRTSLWNANLRGAKHIENAIFDEVTLLPDADWDSEKMIWTKRYIPNVTDMRRYTDPDHKDKNGNPDFWEPEYLKPDYEGEKPWWMTEKNGKSE